MGRTGYCPEDGKAHAAPGRHVDAARCGAYPDGTPRDAPGRRGARLTRLGVKRYDGFDFDSKGKPMAEVREHFGRKPLKAAV